MNNIPKTIHWCWFGGNPKPPIVEACVESWGEYLTDYEINYWNESNVDIDSPVFRKALKDKMWAFAADFARLHLLYKHGGVYLDTDMEIIKSIDSLLCSECFFAEEREGVINGGVIGSIKGSAFIKAILDEMKKRFDAGEYYTTIPIIITDVFNKYPNLDRVVILKADSFYPFNPYDANQPVKQLMYRDVTNDTYGIHHWQKSWNYTLLQRIRRKIYSFVS